MPVRSFRPRQTCSRTQPAELRFSRPPTRSGNPRSVQALSPNSVWLVARADNAAKQRSKRQHIPPPTYHRVQVPVVKKKKQNPASDASASSNPTSRGGEPGGGALLPPQLARPNVSTEDTRGFSDKTRNARSAPHDSCRDLFVYHVVSFHISLTTCRRHFISWCIVQLGLGKAAAETQKREEDRLQQQGEAKTENGTDQPRGELRRGGEAAASGCRRFLIIRALSALYRCTGGVEAWAVQRNSCMYIP